MSTDVFQTVATFLHPTWGEIVKAKLESEGIESRYLNENIVLAHNGLATAVGGVKLQVRHSDVSRANVLLDEYQNSELPSDEDLSEMDVGEFEDIAENSVADVDARFRMRAIIILAAICALIYVVVSQPELVINLRRLLGL